jgi:multisubunit Na+/H+ antiporter MnhB subunit
VDPGLERLLLVLLALAGLAVASALVLLALLYRRLRRLRVPEGADLWDTLRAVPLGLVVVVDLLDLGLDVLSAPIVWWLLGHLRLGALRQVATAQALVPLSGPVPVLTVAWAMTRLLGLGRALPPDVIDTREVAPGRFAPRE